MPSDLQVLTALFEDNFTQRGELGASLSIWRHDQEILSLAGGFRDRNKTLPWSADTPVLVWSATKGLAAGTFLAVLEREQIELDCRVAEFWPEFASGGKAEITLAQLLSHQAGLCGLREPTISLFDYEGVIASLADQEPLWIPGTRHGYHTRTFGFLLDEVLRRITGETLARLWREIFAVPLGLDFWIGLPPERVADVAPVFPARNPGGLPDDDFWRAMAQLGTPTKLAFGTPAGLASVASMNSPEARMASFLAFGGIGTAASLGKWYAMLACGGEMEGRRYVSEATIASMSATLSNGPDAVLLQPTAFSAGFMQDPVGPEGKIRHLFGPSTRAFGHPGAGGSHAFADPENGLAFAYVMNQMELGIFPNAKSLLLVEALYE